MFLRNIFSSAAAAVLRGPEVQKNIAFLDKTRKAMVDNNLSL